MLIFNKGRARCKRAATRMCPRLEALEGRVVLSTFTVNTTADAVAVNLKTGQDSTGHISLRSAIMAANANPRSDMIILPAGIFKLTIPGRGENNDKTGDLDISSNLTIKGQGAGTSIIDGNNLDRVFEILSGKVTISRVTIQHGLAMGDLGPGGVNYGGGGILNLGGNVTLSSVNVFDNRAFGTSGAFGGKGNSHADGLGTSVGGNGTDGTIAEGGGIYNAAGTLTIQSSTIDDNEAIGGSGGYGGPGAAPTMTAEGGGTGHYHFGGNGGTGGDGGDAEGGGLYSAAGALTISSSTIMGNEAIGGDGGNGGAGAAFMGKPGAAGANGVPANGGKGGAGGNGGNARGGGVFNDEDARLSISGTTFSSNEALSGLGGAGGEGGAAQGGDGGAYAKSGAGKGGDGTGGSGGGGGTGGVGSGGGLRNTDHGVVIFSGAASTFFANTAIGSSGGAGGAGGTGTGGNGGAGGSAGENGGAAGTGDGGNAGPGANSGNSFGGGITNDGSLVSTVALTFNSNLAQSHAGGNGGAGGSASGGAGGQGGPDTGSLVAVGGLAEGGNGGAGGAGGSAQGAGLDNSGSFTIQPPSHSKAALTSSFTHNEAVGGPGGVGGDGGNATGGSGGSGAGPDNGGGGQAVAGEGAFGGEGGSGYGGGLADTGTVAFIGVTVNFQSANAAGGSAGGQGGNGGNATGGTGQSPTIGGAGGDALGGNGGFGGGGGDGFGGGIAADGSATIDPRHGARRGSKQAKATDTISGNNAIEAPGGGEGNPGEGSGGSPGGGFVLQSNGNPGIPGAPGTGMGGGAAFGGKITDPNTTIAGNNSSSGPNNVDNNFKFPPG